MVEVITYIFGFGVGLFIGIALVYLFNKCFRPCCRHVREKRDYELLKEDHKLETIYSSAYHSPVMDELSEHFNKPVEPHVPECLKDCTDRIDRSRKAFEDIDYAQLDQEFVDSGVIEDISVVVAIDATRSNKFKGRRTFGGQNLHMIHEGLDYQSNHQLRSHAAELNPYEQCILAAEHFLHTDSDFPLYFFGSDQAAESGGFLHVKDCEDTFDLWRTYRETISTQKLAGPGRFVPLLERTMERVKHLNRFHVLLILTDGDMEDEREFGEALARATESCPLAVVIVGVGDGPFDVIEHFDDNIDNKRFDNMQFVAFNDVATKTSLEAQKEDFFTRAFNEVPRAYRACRQVMGYRAPMRRVRRFTEGITMDWDGIQQALQEQGYDLGNNNNKKDSNNPYSAKKGSDSPHTFAPQQPKTAAQANPYGSSAGVLPWQSNSRKESPTMQPNSRSSPYQQPNSRGSPYQQPQSRGSPYQQPNNRGSPPREVGGGGSREKPAAKSYVVTTRKEQEAASRSNKVSPKITKQKKAKSKSKNSSPSPSQKKAPRPEANSHNAHPQQGHQQGYAYQQPYNQGYPAYGQPQPQPQPMPWQQPHPYQQQPQPYHPQHIDPRFEHKYDDEDGDGGGGEAGGGDPIKLAREKKGSKYSPSLSKDGRGSSPSVDPTKFTKLGNANYVASLKQADKRYKWQTSSDQSLDGNVNEIRRRFNKAIRAFGDDYYRLFFNYADEEESSELSFQKFIQCVRKCCHISPAVVDNKELEQLFRFIDTDSSGQVSLDEFVAFCDDGLSESEKRNRQRRRLSLVMDQEQLDALKRRFKAMGFRNGGSSYRALFTHVDRNNNNKIEYQEFRRAVRNIGKLTERMFPDQQLRILFEKVDFDGSGAIDEQEFVEFIEHAWLPSDPRVSKKQVNEHALELHTRLRRAVTINLQLFNMYDTNDTGTLEFEEFEACIREACGVSPDFMSRDDLVAVFNLIDTNHNKRISAEELANFLNKDHPLFNKKPKKKKTKKADAKVSELKKRFRTAARISNKQNFVSIYEPVKDAKGCIDLETFRSTARKQGRINSRVLSDSEFAKIFGHIDEKNVKRVSLAQIWNYLYR